MRDAPGRRLPVVRRRQRTGLEVLRRVRDAARRGRRGRPRRQRAHPVAPGGPGGRPRRSPSAGSSRSCSPISSGSRRSRRAATRRTPASSCPATSTCRRDVIGRYGGHGREVHRRRGHGRLGRARRPRGRRRARRPSGLDLVAAVETLGPGIAARAGVLTGEAAVTIGATNQGMVAGDLVNTASRAPVRRRPGDGPRRRGDRARRVSRDRVRAGGRAGAQGQGGAGPGVASPPGRSPSVGGRNRSETLEAPFVGRDDELRLLKDLFHATTANDVPASSRSSAPAGIGKTTARLGVQQVPRRPRRERLVPRRTLAGIRRGHQLLGAGRDGAASRGPARDRRRADHAREGRRHRRGARPGRGRAALDRAGPARPARRRRGRGCSRRAVRRLADLLRAARGDGHRSSWSSRTSTMPTAG